MPMTKMCATEVVDRRARVASTRRLEFEERGILTFGRGLESRAGQIEGATFTRLV